MNIIEKSVNKSSDKLFLRSLIMRGSERIQLIALNGSAQSLKYYKRVTVDGYLTPFVCCNRCQCVIQYLTRVGTSGLNRHLNYCNNNNNNKTKPQTNGNQEVIQDRDEDQDIGRKVFEKQSIRSQLSIEQVFDVNKALISCKTEPNISLSDDNLNQSSG